MLRIQCRCGETFHADDGHVGRTLRCRCGRTLKIRAPRPSSTAALRARVAAGADGLRHRISQATRGRSGARVRRPTGVNAHGNTPDPRLARWTGWAAWGYLGLALLAVLVLWGLGERWWLGTVMLFGPRWLLLLPLVLLAPAALLLRRWSLVPVAVAAVLVVGPVMGLRVGWRGLLDGGGEGVGLRIASFNALGIPSPVLDLVRLMERWEIQVAAIQECSDEVPALMQFRPGWHVHHTRNFCLISRYPVLSADRTRWEELDVARGTGIGGSGAAVRYRVQAPDRELQLVSLHLETPRKGLERLRYELDAGRVEGNTTIREIGSRRAFGSLGPNRDSLLVLGDFNMPVESTIYRESWSALGNAFSQAGWGLGMTKDNGWIRARIDHILMGRHWRARRAWVGPDLGSDHWPVFAEVRWIDDR